MTDTRFTLNVLDTEMRPAWGAFDRFRKDVSEYLGLPKKEAELIYNASYLRRLAAAGNAVSRSNSWINFNNVFRTNGTICNWYDCEADMLAISHAFPEFIFELHVKGETTETDSGIWIQWFHAGYTQGGKAKLTLPKFTEDAWVNTEPPASAC